MTDTKFTPGPWETFPAANYNGFAIAPKGVLPTLAAVERPKGIANTINITAFNFPGATEANAHLIAAAPELYAALEAAIEEINHLRKFAGDNGAMIDDTDFVEGIAALAKARGEA